MSGKEYQKEYYEKNKEKIALQQKKYKEKNKEKIVLRYKKWYEENKKWCQEYGKHYHAYIDHRETLKRKYRVPFYRLCIMAFRRQLNELNFNVKF